MIPATPLFTASGVFLLVQVTWECGGLLSSLPGDPGFISQAHSSLLVRLI